MPLMIIPRLLLSIKCTVIWFFIIKIRYLYVFWLIVPRKRHSRIHCIWVLRMILNHLILKIECF